MYTPDIITLRYFYATQFGESVRRLIANGISQLWPTVNDDIVVGLGYATPYLSPYLKQAALLAVCMPASQGASCWPPGNDNLVVIAHDSELPFAENSVNRVILVHSIENSEHLSWMIKETWRILTPNGRILIIAPNRRGMWSRSSNSPFGYGRPFNVAQMHTLLSEHNFVITNTNSALFMPPTRIKFLWSLSNKLETIGKFICHFLGIFLGGVLLVEAEKQLYSAITQPVVEERNYRRTRASGQAVMTREKQNIVITNKNYSLSKK